MAVIDLNPLDSEGLAYNKPQHSAKWAKLTNVAFRDGSLVPRAGFREVYGFTKEVVETGAVEPAPANGLVEIYNPGSSSAGRGGAAWVTEMLRPDGSSSLVAGWAASATTLHGDTDEVVPDGAYAESSTAGSRFALTFANPSATYTDILGVRIYVRAKVVYTGVNDATAALRLYQRLGTDLYTITDFEVWAYDVNETDFWYDYSFLLEKNYSDSQVWDDGDLDSLQIAIEFTQGESGIQYHLQPLAIDSNTGWTDASDGGAAVIADVTLANESTPASFPNNSVPASLFASAKAGNGIAADATNDVIQFSYAEVPAGVTFSVIDRVDLAFRVKTERYDPVPYEVYYNNGSTDTLIASGTTLADCRPYSEPIIVTMTTNPVSLAAWTKAEVNAASFKFKLKAAVQLTMEYTFLSVVGNTNSATVRIDTVSAEILAPGTASPPDKLILSNRSFLRVQPEDITLDDVTNSVPSNSLPSVAPFDHAILYGQTYVVNGVDPTKRYPNAGSLFESLTTNNADGATPITGRTVCAFADRILYGWVRDNTTYTPERIAYSKEFNGGTHNDASAGDFDIIDSMGGVVALRPLNESLCFCGKEFGIYALRRTGNAAFPIIVDPIDYETSCLAKNSALRVLVKGMPTIVFFGMNPTSGLNVFAFDGTAVRPIGDAINPMLEELANPKMNPLAIGAVDPKTNSYILFLAPDRSIERSIAFAMNLNSLAWTKWELPYSIYSAGQWMLPASTALVFQSASTNLGGEAFMGLPTLVLGGRNNLALQAHDLPFDSLTAEQNDGQLGVKDTPGFIFDTDPRPLQKSIFTSTMETGDIQIVDAQSGEIQLMSFRLHLDYINYGPVRLEISHSIDGGLTFETDVERFIGTMEKDGSAQHTFVDFSAPVHDRKVRFRIKAEPEDATFDLPFFWQIDRIFVEYTPGGIDGP